MVILPLSVLIGKQHLKIVALHAYSMHSPAQPRIVKSTPLPPLLVGSSVKHLTSYATPAFPLSSLLIEPHPRE
jgi:hypothetical protein